MPNNTPTTISQPDTNLLDTKVWLIPFVATILAMMTMQMSSLGFSPLIPAIQKEFGMSYSQVGLFTGIYGLVAMVMSIPGGLLAKRFGEKRALASGLLIASAGLLILSFSPTFAWGLAGRTVWIFGYRISFVCVMTAIAFTAPPSLRSSAMGILGSMSSLATVIGAPFATAMGRWVGWRGGMQGFAVAALLGSLVFALLYRRLSEAAPKLGHHGPASMTLDKDSPRSPFRTPVLWTLVLLGTINMGGFSATFFVPSAIKTVFKLEPSYSALVISSGYITAIVANLLFGYLCDRFNRWNLMIGLCLILIPACFLMMVPNFWVFSAATALLISLGLCATNQIYALAGELARSSETASIMGIASLGGGVFGYLGPQMLGYLRDRTGGFTAGWYFVASGVLVSLIVLIILKRYAQPGSGLRVHEPSPRLASRTSNVPA